MKMSEKITIIKRNLKRRKVKSKIYRRLMFVSGGGKFLSISKKTLYNFFALGYNNNIKLNSKAITEDNASAAAHFREFPGRCEGNMGAQRISPPSLFSQSPRKVYAVQVREYGLTVRYKPWQIIVCFGGLQALVFGVRNNGRFIFL